MAAAVRGGMWAAWTILLAAAIQDVSANSTKVPLESLKPGCRIEVRPTGGGHAASVGAWLLCNQEERGLLLTHPLNLVGHVEIATSAQALEHVRLFSSNVWHSLFPELKIVEVLPGESDGIYILQAAKFQKCCREATVSELQGADRKKRFQINRTAVSLQDINLYEITETLSESGYYEMVSQRLLFKDATKLGLMIAGPM
jgi:hypothetical protein